MKITAIKQQIKAQDRVSIFVDGAYSFSLNLDQLLAEKLKKGADIDDGEVKRLKKLSDEGKLKQRALEWLMNRPHSEREFRDYMYRKKAEKEMTEAWVEDFKDKNYLNDENFARWFAEQRTRKNKSSRAVVAELRSKGINQSVAEETVKVLDADDKNTIKKLVEKLSKRTRYQDKQKLTAYLVSKGFSYSDVKEVINQQ